MLNDNNVGIFKNTIFVVIRFCHIAAVLAHDMQLEVKNFSVLVLPTKTTSKQVGFSKKLSLSCRAASRESVKTAFKAFGST